MGYILTGILVGPSVLHLVTDKEAFESFSEIGIALLLFIIGLGLNAGVIRSLGKAVLFVAGSILLVIGGLGFLSVRGFGFSGTEAAIVGIALFFSSTIIILKALTDKKEQSRLYGRIAVGVILTDDIVATLALVFVAALGTSGGLSFSDVGVLIAKGIGLGVVLALAATKVLPALTRYLAGSQELLFLFTLAWGLGIANVFEFVGFSLEVGALFAGISLASLPYATEMSVRLKPLRDFFIILFFVTLGETFSFGNLGEALVPALILSVIVLIGKPLMIMASLGYLGYTKFTSFKAGIHLSQISEFSILLVVFGYSTGIVSQELTGIITLVALITIGVSTYLMNYDNQLYAILHKRLHLFEKKDVKPERRAHATNQLILFGYRKGGHEFVKSFREMHNKHYIVVDYDPEVIELMESQHIRAIYGDATDYELLEEIALNKAEVVVSVIPDIMTNMLLLKYVRRHNPDAAFVCHADSLDDAARLYDHHASYVILPHLIGSEHVSSFLRTNRGDHMAFEHHRKKHIRSIGKATLH
jgi:Kef-type K+ transport system membrane component KefB